MVGAGLTAEEMLAWDRKTADGWKALIMRNPALGAGGHAGPAGWFQA
jgi:hypothetical protein